MSVVVKIVNRVADDVFWALVIEGNLALVYGNKYGILTTLLFDCAIVELVKIGALINDALYCWGNS